jgi:serine/threonine protein kinase
MHKGNEQKASFGDYPDWNASSENRAHTNDRGPDAQEDICLTPGTMLQNGRYAILAVLPEGRESELSIVYLAEHTALHRKLAIKEYFPRRVAHRSRSGAIAASHQSTAGKRSFEEGMAAFEREACQLAAIKHPNIVRVEDVFRERGTVYLAMEYIDGSNLSARLDEGQRADTDALLAWLTPLLDAVSALHQARPPVYHRDIKPQNIRIRNSDRQPVLLDFGAARGLAGNTTLTMIHTPSYAPPEQTSNLLDSAAVLRPTLDIYAIGATAYHWLTGTPPPDAMGRNQFIVNKTADPLVPLSARITGGRVDARLLMVLDRSLSMRASDRPQSVADIQVVIDIIRGYGGGGLERSPRRPVAAAGLLAGIAIGAAVVYWWEPISLMVEPYLHRIEAKPESAPAPAPAPEPAPASPAASDDATPLPPPVPPPENPPVDARLVNLKAFLDGQPLSFTAAPGIFKTIQGTMTFHEGKLRIENLEFSFEPTWGHDSLLRDEIIRAGQFRIYVQQSALFDMDAEYAQSGDWKVNSAAEFESGSYTPDAVLEIPYQCASPDDLDAGNCSVRIVVAIGDSHTLMTAESLDPKESIK